MKARELFETPAPAAPPVKAPTKPAVKPGAPAPSTPSPNPEHPNPYRRRWKQPNDPDPGKMPTPAPAKACGRMESKAKQLFRTKQDAEWHSKKMLRQADDDTNEGPSGSHAPDCDCGYCKKRQKRRKRYPAIYGDIKETAKRMIQSLR